MTQKDQVLDYMKRFGSITSWQAFQDLGITRLSAVVFNRRADGHNIKGETKKTKTRLGVVTSYSEYRLE